MTGKFVRNRIDIQRSTIRRVEAAAAVSVQTREKQTIRERIHSEAILNVYPVDAGTLLTGSQDRVRTRRSPLPTVVRRACCVLDVGSIWFAQSSHLSSMDRTWTWRCESALWTCRTFRCERITWSNYSILANELRFICTKITRPWACGHRDRSQSRWNVFHKRHTVIIESFFWLQKTRF